MITPETIADIRAALNVATRGPWKCLDRRAGNLTAGYSVWQDLERPYADSPYGKQVCLTPDGSQPSNRKNMELIAMLHNHAPALLDEIERLQEELNRWTGVFAGITPENMRQRMSDLSIANARLTARVAELTAELDDYCRADANINYDLNEGDRNILGAHPDLPGNTNKERNKGNAGTN